MDVVRNLAENDTSRIKFSYHAKEQMEERGIVVRDVYRALRLGGPTGPLKFGDREGEVKLIVTFQPRGLRNMGVVSIVVTETKKVFVKTVMWMDEQ